MIQRLFLVAITGLFAGASVLGLTQRPASADGFSLNVGIPGAYLHYDDWRYHHDRAYHDGWDRWHRGDHHGDEGYRHDDRGWHGDRHDDHHDRHDH